MFNHIIVDILVFWRYIIFHERFWDSVALFSGVRDVRHALVKAVYAVLCARQNIQLILLYRAFGDFLVVGLVVNVDSGKRLGRDPVNIDLWVYGVRQRVLGSFCACCFAWDLTCDLAAQGKRVRKAVQPCRNRRIVGAYLVFGVVNCNAVAGTVFRHICDNFSA